MGLRKEPSKKSFEVHAPDGRIVSVACDGNPAQEFDQRIRESISHRVYIRESKPRSGSLENVSCEALVARRGGTARTYRSSNRGRVRLR